MALGAVVSGYLGFRRFEVWVPTAISCVIVAIQFAMFQVGNNPDVRLGLYVFSLMLSLFVCYATYGIGRAIAQRWRGKR